MIKVQVLTQCEHCKGESYLPMGEAEDSQGHKYTRYVPCPVCEGSGNEPKWIPLDDFAKLLHQEQCPHCHTEYLVFITEGGVSLKMLATHLEELKGSSDKIVSELALDRIQNDRIALQKEFEQNAYGVLSLFKTCSHPKDNFDRSITPQLYKLSSLGFVQYSSDDLVHIYNFCRSYFENQNAKIFRDKFWKEYADTMQDHIKNLGELIPRLQKLIEQENHYRKILQS